MTVICKTDILYFAISTLDADLGAAERQSILAFFSRLCFDSSECKKQFKTQKDIDSYKTLCYSIRVCRNETQKEPSRVSTLTLRQTGL